VLLTEWGRLAEAATAFDRAAALRPGEPLTAYARWRLAVRRQDWPAADGQAAELAGFDDPFSRFRAAASQARNHLFRGRSQAALERLDAAIAVSREPGAFTALGRCWKAELLLQRGEPERALAEAERAQQEGRDDWPELRGLFLAAQALEALGRPLEAARAEQALAERAAAHPNPVEGRQLHFLGGLLAFARGDAEAAVSALGRAAALLPPVGVEVHWHVYPDHVPIWTALGEAELAAGRPERALTSFERAAGSGSERIEQPVPYVRSLYFLGRLHRQRGEHDEARASFERFLAHWESGDLDRDRVAEAIAAVRQGPPPADGSRRGRRSATGRLLDRAAAASTAAAAARLRVRERPWPSLVEEVAENPEVTPAQDRLLLLGEAGGGHRGLGVGQVAAKLLRAGGEPGDERSEPACCAHRLLLSGSVEPRPQARCPRPRRDGKAELGAESTPPS
jgi:tetratricopeptide (TPR) repeat protein